ncbi:MAG TPA: MBL fold metallo-hydrolase [Ktedonobacterales bacterium]|nr:MBL fold metallo-hydrolase [Ktedonobacterales bacterium]
MPHQYLCVTCGAQYPSSDTPPARCLICDDDRQYINPDGQQWTTLAALQGSHTNSFSEIAPGITTISTEPKVGIGEHAHLLQTPHGNVLWDCIAYLDDATLREIQARGGIRAIAISHPHFYSTMIEWSRALGNVPIHLHSDNRPWVMRPDSAVRYWDGESLDLLPGVTLLRCGGHFPGSTVLHWRDANNGAGALFTGDTIKVVADRRWVTFMYSYPNSIPLDEYTVRHIAATVAPLPFTRLYDGWTSVTGDANDAVRRSADRYIAHLRGETAGRLRPDQ